MATIVFKLHKCCDDNEDDPPHGHFIELGLGNVFPPGRIFSIQSAKFIIGCLLLGESINLTEARQLILDLPYNDLAAQYVDFLDEHYLPINEVEKYGSALNESWPRERHQEWIDRLLEIGLISASQAEAIPILMEKSLQIVAEGFASLSEGECAMQLYKLQSSGTCSVYVIRSLIEKIKEIRAFASKEGITALSSKRQIKKRKKGGRHG